MNTPEEGAPQLTARAFDPMEARARGWTDEGECHGPPAGVAVLADHETVTYPVRVEPARDRGTIVSEHQQAIREARAMLMHSSLDDQGAVRYPVTADAVARLACSIVRGWAEVRRHRDRTRRVVGGTAE